MSASATNALDALMRHARNKGGERPKRFLCPGGCGRSVTEREINDHLDRCLGGASDASGADKKGAAPGGDGKEGKRKRRADASSEEAATGAVAAASSESAPPTAKTPRKGKNAFAHMMQRSSAVFSKSNNVIRHRFHLHDAEGHVTWTSEDGADTVDDTANATSPSLKTEEVHWSAVTVIKKVKSISMDGEIQATVDGSERWLELTISSSLPLPQGDKTQRLVRRHSRLSVAQLKSCLQKSIRRRAPLPAVRVAMELVDRSYTDLIRRLPVIVLEDSTLHPNFGFLVWLMVAESKRFFPCMSLLKRVLQVVFEVASCPRQDTLSWNDGLEHPSGGQLPSSISLVAPLFSNQDSPAHANVCLVYVRAMLLRAQYGGMKCDVQMLHSFAVRWMKRFHSSTVPESLLPEPTQTVHWWELPQIFHEKAHEKSTELVTSNVVFTGGLLKLTPTDVCAAGIDFHCSSVVEHLLSQPEFYAALCEKLTRLNGQSETLDREYLAGQMKRLIWNYSSGVNHRRSFEDGKQKEDDRIAKMLWQDVVKEPFNSYTKKFVSDRLS